MGDEFDALCVLVPPFFVGGIAVFFGCVLGFSLLIFSRNGLR